MKCPVKEEFSIVANKDPVLTPDEFQKCQNNFRLFFTSNFIGEMYRRSEAYTLCLEAHPERFLKLSSELRRMYVVNHTCIPEDSLKLYEAYEMMHPYAESNRDLFR